MVDIPPSINGVSVHFADGVDKSVTNTLLSAMKHSIQNNYDGHDLETIWISSAKDSHNCPSRHVSGNGVDISRINGLKIGLHYETDSSVKRIVDGLQNRYETAPSRRENYGPSIKKKEGVDNPVSGHSDHFHWSVNGDHSICSLAIVQKIMNVVKSIFHIKEEEVCNI